MKLIILSMLLALATAKVVDNKITTCNITQIINGINHEKEVLKEFVDITPIVMSIDYDKNILFYTYFGDYDLDIGFAALNLKTKENYIISGVTGGYSISVDPKTHKTYIGGDDGIYEFDYQSKVTTNLNITTDKISHVFAKDGVYFTTDLHEYAFVYKNGELKKISGIGDNRTRIVGLDKEDNIFFSNYSGLFLRPKDDNKVIKVGDYAVRSFTADVNGKLYFGTVSGLYTVNEVTKKEVNISPVYPWHYIFGAVAELDGIIYAMDNSINRLKSTGQKCF